MRVPRVKSDSLPRRKTSVASSGPLPRSIGVVAAVLHSDPIRSDPIPLRRRVVVMARSSSLQLLSVSPLRGEHHILYAREAQARHQSRGSFFSLGRHAAPSPRRTPVHPQTRSRGDGR